MNNDPALGQALQGGAAPRDSRAPRGIFAKVKTAAVVLLLGAGMAQAEGVPSGLALVLHDLVIEPEAGIARFRFVAPDLRALEFAEVEGDLPWLCDHVALPEIADAGWTVSQVVISIGDREVPFGEMDAEALQYFEAFSFADGFCVEEYF